MPEGQLINITLVNFARVGLPSDWGSAPGVAAGAASQSSATSAAGSVHVQTIAAAAVRPKVCYQLADIREAPSTLATSASAGSSNGGTGRGSSAGIDAALVRTTVTECEGSPRLSHVYTSSTNAVAIEVIVAKILNVHFLLHFKGNTQ